MNVEKGHPIQNSPDLTNFDIESLVSLAIELKLDNTHSLVKYFRDDSFRQLQFSYLQNDLFRDTLHAKTPILLNGASVVCQAFGAVFLGAAGLTDKIDLLKNSRISSDILKSYAQTATVADNLFKGFKEMANSNLEARRVEIDKEGARSLADFISQTYKRLQQEEAEGHRENAQHENRKNDFEKDLTR